MPAGYVLKAGVLTIGSTAETYSFEVLVNAGSNAFQLPDPGSLLSGNGLAVGMPIVPSVQAAPPAGLPNGLAIVAVNQPTAGSIQLGGGYSPWLNGSGQAPWIYAQPASKTLSTTVTAIDEYPDGWLTATVTPSTGVTIADYSFDGTGNDNHVGDGSNMSNSGGQAMGLLAVTFADAGSYVLSVAYTSVDDNYADGSSSLAVTVT
jgi:hypothetical protein